MGLALALAAALAARAVAAPPIPMPGGSLPASLATLGVLRLQGLLQSFVDRAYMKSFRHLGEERDFDHGHLIFASDAPDAKPVAILYHTQELALYEKPGSEYGWLDPEGRNWVQWLSDGRVQNARELVRAVMPKTLPVPSEELARHHTILADMLDPAKFGGTALRSRQVVFTKTACAATAALRVALAGKDVCLALSEY